MELTGRNGRQEIGSLLYRRQSPLPTEVSPRARSFASLVEATLEQNMIDVQNGTALAVSSALDAQMMAADASEDILTGSDATLAEVESAVGSDSLINWAVLNVAAVNEMVGPRNKFEPVQLGMLARMLVRRFRPYKARELLLFLSRMSAGEYGSFYGSADLMKVGEFVNAYMARRADEISRYEREQARACMERSSAAATSSRANYIAYMREAIGHASGQRKAALESELKDFLDSCD